MEAGDEALTTKAIVNGRDYIMVVDTGATHPFIPENTLREMKEHDPGIKTIPCPTFRVRVAGGAIVTGKTAEELTITLPDIGPRVLIVTIRMLVIPGSGRMLLGCSALRALGLLSDEGLHIYKPQTPSQATDGDDDIALDHPYLACAVVCRVTNEFYATNSRSLGSHFPPCGRINGARNCGTSSWRRRTRLHALDERRGNHREPLAGHSTGYRVHRSLRRV
ncbi:hypothetical protein J8273_1822 [Carpediemonas membranifera]|uniref:Aspartyl protease n=1 Tax=Carpediemonas membranifera TaxID=201153 RepID=A0A8J6AWR4_9EUKA|nr:hypothetical protein J8273_1822 [Carpediemonas membranifera]|eukprot:KAG9396781.1 hypothetical protein J8273_1822 [Carpediemonas membranifera]